MSFHRVKPVHTHLTRTYSNYRRYKDLLANDFHECCGYCDDHHSFSGGQNNYHIDHFAPKSIFPTLENEYSNLVYSCPYCNRSKSDKWVSSEANENIVDGIGFADPCDTDYDAHLYRKSDGSIAYKDSVGEYMFKELNLCLERHRIAYMMDMLDRKIDQINEFLENKETAVESIANGKDILLETYNAFHSYYKICKHMK